MENPTGIVAEVRDAFDWKPQPSVAVFLREMLDAFCDDCPPARELAEMLLRQTGTRLADWVDHYAFPAGARLEALLRGLGFAPLEDGDGRTVWEHARAAVPSVELTGDGVRRLAVKVESVDKFLDRHGLAGTAVVHGGRFSPLRMAKIAEKGNAEIWVVERHGRRGWEVPFITVHQFQVAAWHFDRFSTRKRDFDRRWRGFDRTEALIYSIVDDLGPGWAADLFFRAERDYWTSRNRAARIEKTCQDTLGLGWANHDCHTYRSSREHFARLIDAFEALGMECRERFYAGREAGWGAQILEQRESSIVVAAAVDLGPEEIAGDFAHQPLAPSETLGTIGLWCERHGESFLQAGMHHLACRFDFQAARRQLAQAGIEVSKPSTDLPYLKQAFTQGETWPVSRSRIASPVAARKITGAQADELPQSGDVGSHLAIVQRDEGYKGFDTAGKCGNCADLLGHTPGKRR